MNDWWGNLLECHFDRIAVRTKWQSSLVFGDDTIVS